MAVAKELVLLLFCFLFWFVKGDESIEFKLEHINFIDERVNVTVKCTAPHPIDGINLFLNGSEISYCRTFLGYPYKYCKNYLEIANQNAVSYLLNNSMFYTVEGANNYILSKTLVCRNGGPNDANYSLSIPNANCMTTSNDNTRDIVRFVLLMIIVLVACATYIYLKNEENEKVADHRCCSCEAIRPQDSSNAVTKGYKKAICFISLFVSVVSCTLIPEFDMTIARKIVLSACCLVPWMVQFVIPVNWKNNTKGANRTEDGNTNLDADSM